MILMWLEPINHFKLLHSNFRSSLTFACLLAAALLIMATLLKKIPSLLQFEKQWSLVPVDDAFHYSHL